MLLILSNVFTSEGTSPVPHAATIPVVPISKCQKAYGATSGINNTQLCAEDEKDACSVSWCVSDCRWPYFKEHCSFCTVVTIAFSYWMFHYMKYIYFYESEQRMLLPVWVPLDTAFQLNTCVCVHPHTACFLMFSFLYWSGQRRIAPQLPRPQHREVLCGWHCILQGKRVWQP